MAKLLTILIVGIVLIIVVGILGYYYVYLPIIQREALSKIKVFIRDISIKSIKVDKAVLEIKLEFQNPANVGMTISKIEYSLYGDTYFLGNGSIIDEINLPSAASKISSSTFELTYRGIISVIWDKIIRRETVSWRVIGIVYMKTNIGLISIPFNATITK